MVGDAHERRDWDTVLNTNLKGAFLFTKGLFRALLNNAASIIKFIGHRFNGNPGQAITQASKAGLIGFTQSVAVNSRRAHHGQLHRGRFQLRPDMTAE